MDWETISAIGLLVIFFALIPQPNTAIAGGIDEAQEPEKRFEVLEEIGHEVATIDLLNMVVVDVPRGWELVDSVSAAEVVYSPVSVGNQVDELFDRAWESGTRTYSGLIEYVRATTGKGTSKTRVKAWKEKRGLLDE